MSPDRPAEAQTCGRRRCDDPRLLRRRIRVALGQEAGDLLIAGGEVVNVFTRRIERADLVIADGWIAASGEPDQGLTWRADQTISAHGQLVLPGLVDTHMHLESTLLTPAELARLVVPMGTTTVISDSHEVGNVLGLRGIDMLIAASSGLPVDLFYMASSCVPATEWEDAGARLGPQQVRELLDRDRVLGLAEVMDIPAVLAAEPQILEKITSALHVGRVVDGHAAGLAGRDLIAYMAAGIRSDHESTTTEEARARASLGMLVQVREGSSARNLDAMLPLLASGVIDDSWCLVTDDIFPNDLCRQGHLTGMLRRVAASGVDPAVAVRHASLVPARHYGLADRGAVAPGYCADVAIVDDAREFQVRTVIKGGRIVARDGQCLDSSPTPALVHENTVHLPFLSEAAFRLLLRGASCPVIEVIPGQIVTRRGSRVVRRVGDHWAFDAEQDVALIASIERHRGSRRIGLGLVSGLGLRRQGAIGSTVAHDSHNLILAGTNARDMLACAHALAEQGGGFAVASGGSVRAVLPLPIAGLLSLEKADVVCRQLVEVNLAAEALGCPLAAPFGTLSFLALPVIPELRITAQGLFDVNTQKFLTF
jgi:adenine deaminase